MKWTEDIYPDPKIGDTRKRVKFCWLPFTFIKEHNAHGLSYEKVIYWLETVDIWERYTRESQLEESYWEITDVRDRRW